MNGAGQARYADGQWHRLSPLTPLLRGGIALLAIIGIVLVNLRDLVIELIFSDGSSFPGRNSDLDGDPMVWLFENGFLGVMIAVVLAGLLLLLVGFYFSWRMNTFRITEEVVEVRSGIVFRTHRKGRLDRIQGVNIERPFLARLVGAAKLEVTVAGEGANVKLEYLNSATADSLRLEVLRLASGVSSAPIMPGADAEAGDNAKEGRAFSDLVDRRIGEFLAPERDPSCAPPELVVTMNLGRLIGSTVLSGFTVFAVGVVALVIWGVNWAGSAVLLVIALPALIGLGGFYLSRFMRSLRYSIAATPDGIRIGFGLLTTSNETLPPGRIHAVQVRQPLLWRASGWWEIRVNRASSSAALGAAGQANTTILPVGNLEDTLRVLTLLAPALSPAVRTGLLGSGTAEGFTNSPRRAGLLRWFSWRRNGFALVPGFVLFRTGFLWRQLIIIPEARMQSVEFHQGPLDRALGLGAVKVHTVSGPIAPQLGALAHDDALRLMAEISDAAVSSSHADRSHRWRSAEVAG